MDEKLNLDIDIDLDLDDSNNDIEVNDDSKDASDMILNALESDGLEQVQEDLGLIETPAEKYKRLRLKTNRTYEEECFVQDFPLHESSYEDLYQNMLTAYLNNTTASMNSTLDKILKKTGGNSKQKTNLDRPNEMNPLEITTKVLGNYLIIPDMHLKPSKKQNRLDYPGECLEYLLKIEKIIIEDERINNVIYAGDLFDCGVESYDAPGIFIRILNRIKQLLVSRGGDQYIVLGNHEFTYSKNNPVWANLGILFLSPVHIYDNGTHIYLDRFCSKKSVIEYNPKIEADICISHTEVVPPEIVKEQEMQGRKIYISRMNNKLSRFNVRYLAVGHMHMLCGIYKVEDEETNRSFIYQTLGSIGRTNSNEISDDYLLRNLPLIINKGNGEFDLEQKEITLRPMKETLSIIEAKQTLKRRQEREEFIEYKEFDKLTAPMDQVKSEMNNVIIDQLIDSAANLETYHGLSECMADLRNLLQEERIGY